MAATQPYTPEETLSIINTKALEGADKDRFLVRVLRRRGLSGLYDNVATLADATVRQIASAETWLPRLSGGGEYGLRVAHMDESHVNLGSLIPFSLRELPERQTADISVVTASDWAGPSTIIYPKAADVQAMQAGRNQPPGPPTTTIQGSGLPAIPGAPLAPPQMPQSPQMPPGFAAYSDDLLRRERELTLQQAKMMADLKEKEDALKRSELEQKLRAEGENRTRGLETQLAEMKALLTAKPKEDGFSIDKMIAALTPVVGMIMQSQQTARAEMQGLQQASAAQNAEMLKSLMNKPAISPEILTILEVNKAQSAAQAEMMNHVFTAMKGVSAMSVQMIETVADLQLGQQPEGSPMIDAVREVVKGFGEMQRGVGVAGRKVVQPPPPPQRQALPPQPQTYQQAARAPQTQPPIRQPQVQVAPQPQNGASAQQEPIQLVQSVVEPVPNHPQAFDGLPPSGPMEVDTEAGLPPHVNAIDVLEQLIRQKTQPVEGVAQFFIRSLNRPEVISALNQYDNDINQLVADRLSGWLVAESGNIDYIKQLGETIDRLGEEAGIFEDDDGEPEEEKASDA